MGVEWCIVALFVNGNPGGGFSVDHGWWPDIADRGKYVADFCLVDNIIGGGYGYAGKKN